MSSFLRQTLVLTRAALAGIPRRAAVSLSMILSIALVVVVLIGFLAMAAGLRQTLRSSGSEDVAVILGGGGTQEITSSIPPDAVRGLTGVGAGAGIAASPVGLLLSRELLVPIEAKDRDGTPRTVSLRGMDAVGPALRGSTTISSGRAFAPGSREIVVGVRLARDLGVKTPGGTIRLGPLDWTISGIVSASGGAAESEVWADLDAVRSALDRQGEVQTLRVCLDGPSGLAKLQAALPQVSATPLVAMTEAEILAGQSARMERLVTLFGWPIAVLMAVGAAAGAVNTMASSVSDRTVEIATLRVLGFGRAAAFAATLTEALVLAIVGAILGALASLAILDGWQASTLGAGGTQLAFGLAVTPDVLLQAGALALLVGAVGGVLPSFTATRLPIVEALRGHT